MKVEEFPLLVFALTFQTWLLVTVSVLVLGFSFLCIVHFFCHVILASYFVFSLFFLSCLLLFSLVHCLHFSLGMVVAVKGVVMEGEIEVEEIVFPGLPKQMPLPCIVLTRKIFVLFEGITSFTHTHTHTHTQRDIPTEPQPHTRNHRTYTHSHKLSPPHVHCWNVRL